MELTYQSQSMLPNRQATGAKVFGGFVLGGSAWGAMMVAIIALSHTDVGIFKTTDALGQFVSGAAIALFLAIALLPGYLIVRGEARRVDRCRTAVLDRQYLVRWRYSPQEWAQFRQACAPAEDKRWYILMTVLGLIFLGTLLGSVAIVCSTPNRSDPDGTNRNVAAAVVFGFAVISGGIAGLYAWCSDRRRQLLETPQEAIISTLGAYVNGRWAVWGTSSRVLTNVEVKPATIEAPATLELSISNGSNIVVERVLVPAGQEALAARVAHLMMTSPALGSGGQASAAILIIRIVVCVLRLLA